MGRESSILMRMTIPAMISLMGIVMTQAWYLKTAGKTQKAGAGGQIIAILAAKNNIVERRPTTRIIWEGLNQGEPLFGGEAVRTGAKGSGKITFIKSGMTIGLEPDSLVIIEESNGKLQLNLVNGGVFVKNDTSSNSNSKSKIDQPVLKAGDKKIELSGQKSSELNLSVSAGGNADIKVTKGDVAIAGKSGLSETVGEGKSKSLSSANGLPQMSVHGPASGSAIPLTGINDKLNLAWEGVPPGATVFVETGTSRDSMTRSAVSAPADLRKLSIPLPAGDFFWRLVAMKDGKIISTGPTTFNQSVALETPKLLSLTKNEKVIAKKDAPSSEVHLAWTRPPGAESVTVYLSRDNGFKDIVASKSFQTETEWTVPVKEPGIYHWRTMVSWPGMDKHIYSEPGTFELTAAKDVPTPIVDAFQDNSIFSRQITDTNGISLSWIGLTGVDGYMVVIDQGSEKNGFKQIVSKKLTGLVYRITHVPPGAYRWSVKAFVGESESKASTPLNFQVVDLAHMILKNQNLTQNPIELITADTPVEFALKGVPPAATTIRFKIAADEEQIKATPWQQVPSNRAPIIHLTTVGNFKFMAEALDDKQHEIGTTDQLNLSVKAPDLLPAPELLTGSQSLKTGETGDIDLKWKKVDGAIKYIVAINGPKTQFQKIMATTSLKISGLLPGQNQLVLIAVDKNGKKGKPSEAVTLIVPDTSNIAAPTSKGIKIR